LSHSFRITVEEVAPEAPRAPEVLVIHENRVLLGNAAHCDIRIAAAAREHLVLLLDGKKVLAEARQSPGQPSPSHAGKALVRKALESGDVVVIAGTKITIELVDRPDVGKKARTTRLATTLLAALAAVASPALLYTVLWPSGERPIGPPPAAAPVLFGRAPDACRVNDPAQAEALGNKLRALGELQRERHPFSLMDGLAAVGTFQAAATCLERAGRKDDAKGALDAATALRARIDHDYLVHRVRLEHALDIDDERSAKREVKVLRTLTTGRTGAYVDWLAIVERQLDARAARARGSGFGLDSLGKSMAGG
jgi:hypothetical protein